MKAADIVTQLCVLLPQLTDKFTDDIPVASMTRSGTVITVICDDEHKLEVGRAVAISGADTPIVISSLTRSGAVGTLVTATNHDLTEPIAPTIRLTGSNEAEFSGTFVRLAISNRKTITFTMIDSGPTTATGSPVLRDAESALRAYNGTYEVEAVLSPTQFTFTHSVSGLPNPDGTIVVRNTPRISAGIDIDRIVQAYTEQKINEWWMFVVLGPVDASQSRRVESDATDNIQRGQDYRQQIIDPFAVYVFVPVEAEIAARNSRDEMSDLFRPILRSLLFSQFDTGLYSAKQNTVQFTGHSVHSYDGALYIHEFSFQQVADILFEDTVGADLDVAFRDIDFSIFLDFGTQVNFMQAQPDLDDVQLP